MTPSALDGLPIRLGDVLQVGLPGAWRTFPCSLLSNAPGTDARAVEAPVAVIDAATGYLRHDLSYLTGKAVLHLSPHFALHEEG